MLSKKSRAPQKKSCQKKVVPKKKVVPEKTNIVKRKLDDKNWVALTGLLIRKHLYSQSDDQRRLEQKVLILRISNEYLIISIVAYMKFPCIMSSCSQRMHSPICEFNTSAPQHESHENSTRPRHS